MISARQQMSKVNILNLMVNSPSLIILGFDVTSKYQ